MNDQPPHFPAAFTVHWPSGPTPACPAHKDKLLALGGFMGFHVSVTDALDGAECNNCINEKRSRA